MSIAQARYRWKGVIRYWLILTFFYLWDIFIEMINMQKQILNWLDNFIYFVIHRKNNNFLSTITNYLDSTTWSHLKQRHLWQKVLTNSSFQKNIFSLFYVDKNNIKQKILNACAYTITSMEDCTIVTRTCLALPLGEWAFLILNYLA